MITKGEKIKARFYTHNGVKDVEKYSWICNCGRKYQSKTSAHQCDESNHKRISYDNLINLNELPINILTLEEKNILGLLKVR